jgi:two-component system, cell cycle response regulator
VLLIRTRRTGQHSMSYYYDSPNLSDNICRIMIIDRSEVARSIIAHILQKEMHHAYIVTCGSAEEALEYLNREKFDLITTALLLPGLDGLDLCHQVRKSPKQHQTPVIVVSSDADRRLLREGFSAGVTDYFNKSLGYKKLVEFIKDVSQRHSGLVGKVLYVEDSPSTAEQTQRLMQNHGLQITHVTNAEQALALLKASKRENGSDYDVVFTDFFLETEMTGGDLLYAIRSQLHYSRQELPVLVVTVTDNEECQADVFHAGANDFITKPVIEEVLIARLKCQLLIKHQYNVLQRYSREMQQLASTDSLTSVKNKPYLLDNGPDFIKKHPKLCIITLDIDNLQEINKAHNDLVGDHILHAVGHMLSEAFEEDGEDVMVARMGGKKFTVLRANWEQQDGENKAEILCRKIATLRPEGIQVSATTAVLFVENPKKPALLALLAQTDALLEQKQAARNSG